VNRVVADRPPSDPEGDLLLRARRDPGAFGQFYDRSHAWILRYFMLRTADAATSADLASETFAAALEGVHRFDPDKGTGRAWLAGIARHVLQQYLRREEVSTRARRRLGIRFPEAFHLDLDRIDDLIDLREVAADLGDAIHSLPEGMRKAVLLRVVEQLPYDEIAVRLGCSAGSARVRVCRGLDRLEAYLEAS
jgi:RNA polymerase sigma factor (sigma-70 family)